MKIIFLLKNGTGQIQWEVPADQAEAFVFGACVLNMRCNGFFQSADLHIAYSEVAVMIFDRGGQGPQIVVPQGSVLQ